MLLRLFNHNWSLFYWFTYSCWDTFHLHRNYFLPTHRKWRPRLRLKCRNFSGYTSIQASYATLFRNGLLQKGQTSIQKILCGHFRDLDLPWTLNQNFSAILHLSIYGNRKAMWISLAQCFGFEDISAEAIGGWRGMAVSEIKCEINWDIELAG